jgi:hypothetical protein
VDFLMMVTHLFTSVAPGALILISITLGCTSIDVYISVDGCMPILVKFSSLASFCFAYASIDYYSIASSSFNSNSMFIRSTNVIPSPSCSLARQPFYICANSCLRKLHFLIVLFAFFTF